MKPLLRFAATCGQEFLFETGSETADGLHGLLEDIGEPNAGVNFDPANVLIYGKGDPAEFVAKFGSRIKVVHCKDANPPEAGAARGRETPLGKGSTHFSALLGRLLDSGFCGPLVIERELPPGPEQERDVAEAARFLLSIVKGHQQCSK
jgi:sugar phosphate isomerase/epimerase